MEQLTTRFFDAEQDISVGPWIDEWIRLRDELYKLRGDEISDGRILREICSRYPTELQPAYSMPTLCHSIADLREKLVEWEKHMIAVDGLRQYTPNDQSDEDSE